MGPWGPSHCTFEDDRQLYTVPACSPPGNGGCCGPPLCSPGAISSLGLASSEELGEHIEEVALGLRKMPDEPQLCFCLAVQPCTNQFTSLSLSVLTDKTRAE